MSELTNGNSLSGLVENTETDRKGWTATGFSGLGALAMTSCCILPLVLVSFGVGGVWIAQLTALYAYKWYTFAISAAFLSYGFWKAYRPVEAQLCQGGSCAKPLSRTLMRGILWAAAVIVAVAMIFPYLTPYILSY